jgi:hypothetical protein
MPKPDATIADRPAVETRTSDNGCCEPWVGTKTITVMIARGGDNWFQTDACLRAPGLFRQEARVAAMLSTVRIATGDLALLAPVRQ